VAHAALVWRKGHGLRGETQNPKTKMILHWNSRAKQNTCNEIKLISTSNNTHGKKCARVFIVLREKKLAQLDLNNTSV